MCSHFTYIHSILFGIGVDAHFMAPLVLFPDVLI